MQDPFTPIAKYSGDFVFSTIQTQRMLEKYLLPNKNISFVEKKNGVYYAFMTPDNKIYLLDENMFSDKFIGPSIRKDFKPEILERNDTFRIENKNFKCILQYKHKLEGDYYVIQTDNTQFIISGLDVDTLSPVEKKRFVGDE